MIALTIAIVLGNLCASAFVDVSRSVANTTGVKRAHTIVHVVANAIGIRVFGAIASANAYCIQLIALTIAVTLGNLCASAFVDRSRSSAHSTLVGLSYTRVEVVAQRVRVKVERQAELIAAVAAWPNQAAHRTVDVALCCQLKHQHLVVITSVGGVVVVVAEVEGVERPRP